MTQIIKENGKTIIKTGQRIDTMNAPEFERISNPHWPMAVSIWRWIALN